MVDLYARDFGVNGSEDLFEFLPFTQLNLIKWLQEYSNCAYNSIVAIKSRRESPRKIIDDDTIHLFGIYNQLI
jgi:hypothetical protein